MVLWVEVFYPPVSCYCLHPIGCSDSCSMNSALISQIHFIAVGTGWDVPMTFTWNINIYVSFFLFLQCSHWTIPRCWVCSYSGKCSSTFQPRTMGRWGPGKGTLKTAVSCAPCHSPLENSAKSMLHFLSVPFMPYRHALLNAVPFVTFVFMLSHSEPYFIFFSHYLSGSLFCSHLLNYSWFNSVFFTLYLSYS